MSEKIPLERAITDKILAYLRTLAPEGCFYKAYSGGMQVSGWPDIVGVYRGRFLGLEVKRPKLGRLSVRQAMMLKKIQEAGGIGRVVYSVEDVRAVIDEVQHDG